MDSDLQNRMQLNVSNADEGSPHPHSHLFQVPISEPTATCPSNFAAYTKSPFFALFSRTVYTCIWSAVNMWKARTFC